MSNSAAFDETAYRRAVEREKNLERTKHTRISQHWTILEGLVLAHDWTAGAEIGVQRGWTTFHLLERFPNLSMTMVDHWEYVPDTGEEGWADYAHADPEYCARRVRERAEGYGSRARVIRLPSVEGAKQVEDESLDFVFIDDDHTTRGATESIRAWAPKVKTTGWIIGHDTDWPTVIKAVDKLLPGWRQHNSYIWSLPKAEYRA